MSNMTFAQALKLAKTVDFVCDCRDGTGKPCPAHKAIAELVLKVSAASATPEQIVYNVAQRDVGFRRHMIEQLSAMGNVPDYGEMKEFPDRAASDNEALIALQTADEGESTEWKMACTRIAQKLSRHGDHAASAPTTHTFYPGNADGSCTYCDRLTPNGRECLRGKQNDT